MKELRTEIEFDATPQEVWDVLVDLPAYADWNPFMKKIQGEPKTGAKLEVRMEPEGERAMTFRPTVLTAEPGRELKWLGHLLVPGIFDGEHRWLIEEAGPGKVRFTRASGSAGSWCRFCGRGSGTAGRPKASVR